MAEDLFGDTDAFHYEITYMDIAGRRQTVLARWVIDSLPGALVHRDENFDHHFLPWHSFTTLTVKVMNGGIPRGSSH